MPGAVPSIMDSVGRTQRPGRIPVECVMTALDLVWRRKKSVYTREACAELRNEILQKLERAIFKELTVKGTEGSWRGRTKGKATDKRDWADSRD